MDIVIPAGDRGILRRSELVARGFAVEEIDRMRRTGRLHAVRRGSYRNAAEAPTPEAAHALAARAAAGDVADDAVFGYVTAAVLLGLPVWDVPLDRVHVLRDRRGGGRVRAGLHVHPATLPAEDVVVLDGLRVTSAARTVVDLARTLAPERALVVADGALHLAASPRTWSRPGAADAHAVEAALDRQTGRHGRAAAGRVLGLADGLSESPGETLSRLAMTTPSLPVPVLQWTVPGTEYRCDFAWPDRGVVGEFDGRTKYGRALRPGDDPSEVLWREKRREDAIRATGRTVVRWIWVEIGDPGPDGMVARLGRVLGV